MANIYRVLGQINPTANTASTLYTCATANGAVGSTLAICNQGATTTFRVAICKGPMMENINNKPIKFGTRTWTEAPKGIPNPIVAQILSNS